MTKIIYTIATFQSTITLNLTIGQFLIDFGCHWRLVTRNCMKLFGLSPDFGPLVKVFIYCTHVVLEIALPLSLDHFRAPISRICGLQDGRGIPG